MTLSELNDPSREKERWTMNCVLVAFQSFARSGDHGEFIECGTFQLGPIRVSEIHQAFGERNGVHYWVQTELMNQS